jgi:Flp pilus assembly protein TadD
LLANEKNFDQAEAALRKAVELDKNNTDAWLNLAQLQLARGLPEAAGSTYERAIQENPKDPRSYIQLALFEERRENWQKSEQLYNKALSVAPEDPVIANNLAYLMLEHGGNIDVALSLAQTARRRAPDIPNIAGTLAWAYYHKGLYKSAIDLLEEASSREPKNAILQYHLGLAYEKVSNKAQARRHLERALQLNPNIAHADGIRKSLAEL